MERQLPNVDKAVLVAGGRVYGVELYKTALHETHARKGVSGGELAVTNVRQIQLLQRRRRRRNRKEELKNVTNKNEQGARLTTPPHLEDTVQGGVRL